MNSNQTNNKGKRRPKWLKVVGIIVTVLVILFVAGYFIANQTLKAPEKVGNEFVADMQQNDPRAAYNLYPSNEHEETQSILAQAFTSFGPHVQGTAKVIGGLKQALGKNQDAVLIYQISGNNPTAYVKVTLAQETTNNTTQWYITSFRGSNTKPALNFNIND